ncbi:DUF4097 family beta strand repeat-containing protein [Modestobacter sp. VKM Ac-2979]|uniref:DUF4097 family beta strand repeat-containing protein n=1 Tax=unclassified Modestobacter TaxID=2643866 RepID=UPI0022AB95FA|nr:MULTISPECIES: DUF4097 family beta strand repeat-containing protein [unclassified Modestobacter]MCZ2813648.1 DUF4097 family beta strand repeat-containing protein [Modestobacter sp. VKM Ac-2979]MCZ2844377.1 DUF4097 family beta strand repeat-containing protein [Modestobacter sp. VKM Ac-2980]
MTVRTHRFPPADPPRTIEVRNPAGQVAVRAVEGATEVVVTVQALDGAGAQLLDRIDVSATGTALRVAVPERRMARTPRYGVEVTTPPDADVTIATASGGAELSGSHGRVTVTTASGDVTVEHAAELRVRSASGDVRTNRVDGPLTITTASSDLHLDDVRGPVDVRTASGDVVLGRVATDVSAKTASGDVRVERAVSGTVRVTTVSGDTTIAVEPGLRVWLDVQSISGRLTSDLDADTPGSDATQGEPLSLLLTSVSGDLRLRRAAAAPGR